MSTIDRLVSNYSRQVRLPWARNLSGKQRVWLAVHPPADERRVRARLPQFEAITMEARHAWSTVDLTRLLPEWIAAHEYREGIFEDPSNLSPGGEMESRATGLLVEACTRDGVDHSSVVAVVGLASLFDYVRVSSLIEQVEDHIRGRLLLFFPGEYRLNTYRFMDARDGFNYMAVPITSTETFINP